VNEVRERLCSGGMFMKIGSLSAEGIRSYDRLGLKAVSADGAAQFDLTQRSHDTLFITPFPAQGIFVPYKFFNTKHYRSC
jgi:hypothetical protein